MSGDQLDLDAIHKRWCEGGWSLATPDIEDLVAEVRRLRAIESDVRSLADEWDNLDPGLAFHMVHWDYRTELRAALDDPE